MKFTFAVVEDNIEYQNQIVEYMNRFKEEHDIQFDIHVFNDGDEITDEYESIYDIIFFDIEMKRLDGMTAAKKIRELDSDVIIIFITNMAQYAIKGYSVDALSFILKPVSYFAFSQELLKCLNKIKNKKEKFLIVPTENGMLKLSVSTILYIESIKHYVNIYTKDEDYTIRSTMKRLEEKLKGSSFYRCNNSYLVNLARIDAVIGDFIQINDEKLKISRPRKKEFMEVLADYLGDEI